MQVLTVDHQSPFVLDAALRHKWILCPARQVLAIVFAGHSDRENTQGLIPGLGEMLCHSLDLPCAQPPGHQSFGSGSGTFALNVVGLVRRQELVFGEDVHGHWFYWHRKTCLIYKSIHRKKHLYNSRFTSRIMTLVLGGERCVLLAMQTALAFSKCRPMLGKERRLIVVPSGRCSKDSSIRTLSRYQVTFGGGLPVGILYNCDY